MWRHMVIVVAWAVFQGDLITGAVDPLESESAAEDFVHPVQCSDLRLNGYVMLKNRPCKITEISENGRSFKGVEVINGEMTQDVCPDSGSMNAPSVKTGDLTLTKITADGLAAGLGQNGEEKRHIKVPPGDLRKLLKEAYALQKEIRITVMTVLGAEYVVSFKEMHSERKEN